MHESRSTDEALWTVEEILKEVICDDVFRTYCTVQCVMYAVAQIHKDLFEATSLRR